MVGHLIIGFFLGLLCVAPFLRACQKTLLDAAFLALAMMLMIYIGALLATSDFNRLLIEVVFASAVLLLAFYVRRERPVILPLLILNHGAYDALYGHDAGVADWYPMVCLGFDLSVGLAILFMLFLKSKKTNYD